MEYGGERFLKAGTVLVCPKCGMPQAVLNTDVYPDKDWDFRVISPMDRDAIVGVSQCHDERYVTFQGIFYTEFGPY